MNDRMWPEPIDSQIMALYKAIIGQAALELSVVIDSERVAAYHLRLDGTQRRHWSFIDTVDHRGLLGGLASLLIYWRYYLLPRQLCLYGLVPDFWEYGTVKSANKWMQFEQNFLRVSR